jgi:hypothetical protein
MDNELTSMQLDYKTLKEFYDPLDTTNTNNYFLRKFNTGKYWDHLFVFLNSDNRKENDLLFAFIVAHYNAFINYDRDSDLLISIIGNYYYSKELLDFFLRVGSFTELAASKRGYDLTCNHKDYHKYNIRVCKRDKKRDSAAVDDADNKAWESMVRRIEYYISAKSMFKHALFDFEKHNASSGRHIITLSTINDASIIEDKRDLVYRGLDAKTYFPLDSMIYLALEEAKK